MTVMTQPYELEWDFGERVAKCRKLLGLDQKEFGALFGKSRAAVSNWENGVNQPADVLAFAGKLAGLMRERGIEVTATYIAWGRKVFFRDPANRTGPGRKMGTLRPVSRMPSHTNA